MRKLIVGVFFLVVFVARANAQQLATVTVEARITIPDFLSLQQGSITETTRADGTKSRTVTMYVKANRAWSLAVKPVSSTEKRTDLQIRVVEGAVTGRAGNQIPVVFEISWDAAAPPPPDNSIQYVLAAN